MRVLLALLLCVCASLDASAWQFSSPGKTTVAGGVGGTFNALMAWCPGETDTFAPLTGADVTIYNAHGVGTQFQAGCQEGGPDYEFTTEFTVYIIASCTLGATSSLTMMQTITAISEFGTVTTGPPMVNPQCVQGCVVEHPSGAPQMSCSLYLNPTQTREIGADGWTSCSGTPIQQTGVTCNNPGSELENITEPVAQPMGFVLDSGPEEEEEGEGGAGMQIDDSEICLDENGDGKDDDEETSCALKVAGALKEMRGEAADDFGAIGQGASLGADVTALAHKNGGILGLPARIKDFFNPTPSCSYVFKVPKFTMLGELNITADGWCSVKVKVEPYLAFMMWMFTVFILGSQFRRV